MLLAVGGEGLLRAFPAICPVQQQLKLATTVGGVPFVDDPELGARLAADAHEVVRTFDYEYEATTDSVGFPNAMPWPTTPYVVVLGNSLATGPGVGTAGQFTTLLEESLDGGRVLNLGLPGGSPEQELRIFTKYARSLRPRVVIATLWVASDVDNADHFRHWLAEDTPQDFTSYRKSFGTTHGGLAPVKLARDALSRSYLLRAVFYGVEEMAARDGAEGRVRFQDGEEVYLSLRAQRHLAGGAERPGFDLRADFVPPLQRLQDEVEAEGGRFVVALLPSKEEIYGARSFPQVRNTISEVREALDAAALPLLDLYGAFADVGSARPLFYRRDIHFNAAGNRLVADALGEWVREGT